MLVIFADKLTMGKIKQENTKQENPQENREQYKKRIQLDYILYQRMPPEKIERYINCGGEGILEWNVATLKPGTYTLSSYTMKKT